MVRYLAFVLTGVGIAAVVALVGMAGWRDVLAGAGAVGIGGFALLMGWTAVALLVLGAAWWVVTPGLARGQWLSFAWARTTREAATDVLPFSQFGGLVVGARTAIAGGIRAPLVYASLVADQTTELAAQLVFTIYGVTMLTLMLEGGGPRDLLPLVVGGTAVLGAIMALFAFAQRPVLRMAEGLVGHLLPSSVATVAALRGELDAIYRKPARVIAGFLLHLVAWVFAGAGAWAALALMGHAIAPWRVLAIESLIFTLRTVAFAIPGGLGVQEAAYALIGPVFGLPPGAGLALSLVKRARDLAVGVPGVLLWQAGEARALTRTKR